MTPNPYHSGHTGGRPSTQDHFMSRSLSRGPKASTACAPSPSPRRKERRSRAFRFEGVKRLEDRELLAIVNVAVVDFSFNPDPVTINVGDTIHWVWEGDVHSVTTVAGTPDA